METMIPPQVGMRLRKKNKKIKREAKAAQIKNERKREKGKCYYPFSTLVLQNSSMIFMIESFLFCHFHILVGIFHHSTWLLYSNDGLPQNALGLREQASWMHTHLVSSLSFRTLIALSASVAWQSLLVTLTSIVGHLHSPLISRVNVILSLFCLLTKPPSSCSIPPIVLCPWLALIYCVKVERV